MTGPAHQQFEPDPSVGAESGLSRLAEAALAAIQGELDDAEQQARALLDGARAHADAIRARGEADAHEIMARAEREAEEVRRRGAVEAEAVEMAAEVQARELRMQVEARLWTRLGLLREERRRPTVSSVRPLPRPWRRAAEPAGPSASDHPHLADVARGVADWVSGAANDQPPTAQGYAPSPARTPTFPDRNAEPRPLRPWRVPPPADEPAPGFAPAQLFRPEPAPAELALDQRTQPAPPPPGVKAPAPPAPNADASSEPSRDSASYTISVEPSPPGGAQFRIHGPFTFSSLLAFKQAVIRALAPAEVEVLPSSAGHVSVVALPAEPESALQKLLAMPEFPLTQLPADAS